MLLRLQYDMLITAMDLVFSKWIKLTEYGSLAEADGAKSTSAWFHDGELKPSKISANLTVASYVNVLYATLCKAGAPFFILSMIPYAEYSKYISRNKPFHQAVSRLARWFEL